MKNFLTLKIETRIGAIFILFVGALIALTLIRSIHNCNKFISDLNVRAEGIIVLSSKERTIIENWIEENNLNEYGDSEGTFYSGGTPLFNEATDEQITRYQYILTNHPEKPWRR